MCSKFVERNQGHKILGREEGRGEGCNYTKTIESLGEQVQAIVKSQETEVVSGAGILAIKLNQYTLIFLVICYLIKSTIVDYYYY